MDVALRGCLHFCSTRFLPLIRGKRNFNIFFEIQPKRSVITYMDVSDENLMSRLLSCFNNIFMKFFCGFRINENIQNRFCTEWNFSNSWIFLFSIFVYDFVSYRYDTRIKRKPFEHIGYRLMDSKPINWRNGHCATAIENSYGRKPKP